MDAGNFVENFVIDKNTNFMVHLQSQFKEDKINACTSFSLNGCD